MNVYFLKIFVFRFQVSDKKVGKKFVMNKKVSTFGGSKKICSLRFNISIFFLLYLFAMFMLVVCFSGINFL